MVIKSLMLSKSHKFIHFFAKYLRLSLVHYRRKLKEEVEFDE